MRKKKFLKWVKIILVLYALLGIALYYLQDHILLHPVKLPQNHRFAFPQKFEEAEIQLSKDVKIHFIKFFADTPNRAVVLYFHGNRQNVERYQSFIQPFIKNGYDVWMPDYPGFGKSTGKFEEDGLYSMAYELRKLAATIYADDSIVVYGKSLGTAVATNLAAETTNKLLILETPYYSMQNAISKYMWMYPVSRMIKLELPTHKFLPYVQEPVVILHGTSDAVVRYSSAKQLIPFLKKTDQFITLPGESHNTVNQSAIYYAAMDSLLKVVK